MGFIRNNADIFVFIYLTPLYPVSRSWFHNPKENKYIDPHNIVMLDYKVFFFPLNVQFSMIQYSLQCDFLPIQGI